MLETITHTLAASQTEAWSQTQREALVDAMVWVMYADHFLADVERASIDEHAAKARWAGPMPVKDYTLKSATALRQALGDLAAEKAYAESIIDRLGDKPARDYTLFACGEVSRSDGRTDMDEARLLSRLREEAGRLR
ncbi:MAG: hypothetical protein AAGB29_14900 [Planctomycetota bacterium]